jgi:hypothetical protein
MIDQGLLVSMIAVLAAVWVSARFVRPRTLPPSAVFDAGASGVLVGLFTGRLIAMALEDPSGLTRPLDMLIIRGGVEFWPAVAAGSAALVVSARRNQTWSLDRLADLVPFALWAYAAYEATCLVRDGCFGPRSSLGLRPQGMGSRQVPIGVIVAVSVVILGAATRRFRRSSPPAAIVAAVGGLACVRSVAAVWLPHTSAGPTRQQLESLVVLGAAVLLGAAWVAWALRQRSLRVAVPDLTDRTTLGDGA